jgi:hypothetical protein
MLAATTHEEPPWTPADRQSGPPVGPRADREPGPLDDDAYVRERFEEIVRAEWPCAVTAPPDDPPDSRVATAAAGVPGPPDPPRNVDGPARARRTRSHGPAGRCRERSPPDGPRPPVALRTTTSRSENLPSPD